MEMADYIFFAISILAGIKLLIELYKLIKG
jgi:hypothetical protein